MKAADASETINDIQERKGGTARRIALLIAALAAILAVVEVSGANAEQDAQKGNVDAANLWAFYQAKTIRQTTIRTAAEQLALEIPAMFPDRRDAAQRQLDTWRTTADRYESEPGPSGGEGRKELMQRAKAAELMRDRAMAKDDWFDFASAALQLAIVLASASIVIGIVELSYLAGAVGTAGLLFALLGWFAPTWFS